MASTGPLRLIQVVSLPGVAGEGMACARLMIGHHFRRHPTGAVRATRAMAVTSLQIVVGIICVERLDLGQAAGSPPEGQVGPASPPPPASRSACLGAHWWK